MTTIKKMRSEEDFDLFFKLLLSMQESKGTNPQKLPRKRRSPHHFNKGTGEAYHSPTMEEHYRRQYYEAIAKVKQTRPDIFNLLMFVGRGIQE